MILESNLFLDLVWNIWIVKEDWRGNIWRETVFKNFGGGGLAGEYRIQRWYEFQLLKNNGWLNWTSEMFLVSGKVTEFLFYVKNG